MCFSATASFTVAAATAAIGVVTLARARSWRERPLAAFPLIFAVQQAVEGALWLEIADGRVSGAATGLAIAFLVFAKAIWPALVPLAVWLVEPRTGRRRLLSWLVPIGLAVSGHLLFILLTGDPPRPRIHGHSVYYPGYYSPVTWQVIPYLACTCLPLLASSHRILVAFGIVIGFGYAVSHLSYSVTLVSVWCFFAAAASLLLYAHFGRTARPLPGPAAPVG